MSARQIGAGRIIAALRKMPRGSSKRLAFRAGVSTSQISQVRRGYYPPTEKVAAAVGYRKVILWIREEELALADRIEAEICQPEIHKDERK